MDREKLLEADADYWKASAIKAQDRAEKLRREVSDHEVLGDQLRDQIQMLQGDHCSHCCSDRMSQQRHARTTSSRTTPTTAVPISRVVRLVRVHGRAVR